VWIFLDNAFLSIVPDKDTPGNLLVRARHAGDIEQVFQKARVPTTPANDYRFRAFVPPASVAEAIASQVTGTDYMNFKNSVPDIDRHMAYLRVWQVMANWQAATLLRERRSPSAAEAGKRPRRGRSRLFG
jgi:hypothetical protein